MTSATGQFVVCNVFSVRPLLHESDDMTLASQKIFKADANSCNVFLLSAPLGEEEKDMNDNTQTVTIKLKRCSGCSAQLNAFYKFCRVCGTKQGFSELATKQIEDISNWPSDASVCGPNSSQEATGYRSISNSILNSLVTQDLAPATSRIKSRIAKRTVAAVIAVPLWLLIILLSPLDALEASRQVTRQL